MKPGDRIEIKRRVADALAPRDRHEIDLILTEFNQLTWDGFEGSSHAYVISMLAQSSEEDIVSLAEYVLREPKVSVLDDVGPWKAGTSFKLFLTHLSKHRAFVGQVQTELAWEGIDCFVAHRDIDPSAEWISEVESGLLTCDALAAFLHEGIRDSEWCDQEVGFAFGQRKPLVPLAIELMPYGFLGRYQAILCEQMKPDELASRIVQTLMKRIDTRERLIDTQLSALTYARNFGHANVIANRLMQVMTDQDWTGDRLNWLKEALENSQVSQGFASGPWAKQTLDQFRPPSALVSDDLPF